MALYNIYHGLGGSLGGANYDYTAEFVSEKEAYKAAYDAAWEDYESYEGMHGLRDWEEVAQDYIEDECLDCGINELSEEALRDIDEEYTYEVEGWINYKAVLTSEDTSIEAERIFML